MANQQLIDWGIPIASIVGAILLVGVTYQRINRSIEDGEANKARIVLAEARIGDVEKAFVRMSVSQEYMIARLGEIKDAIERHTAKDAK